MYTTGEVARVHPNGRINYAGAGGATAGDGDNGSAAARVAGAYTRPLFGST
jgi:hypothetical protein